MAHIPDGVLSVPVLAAGAIASGLLVSQALRRLDSERIPQAAVLASAFFVASLVSVPVGPSSVHLVLNGLMGLILGWAAVPAVLAGLLLQTVFFGYGGLLVLGVNTLNLALPALLCGLLLGPWTAVLRGRRLCWLGAAAGAGGAALTGTMVCLSLALSGPEYLPAARIVLVTYLPLILAEAAVTAAAIGFLGRVAPEYLGAPLRDEST